MGSSRGSRGDTPALVARLFEDTQARRELAAATLERLQADLELGTDFDMGSWIERAGEHLGHIQALLESPQSGQAGRVTLRSIVPAPITITPIVDAATGKVREWEFRGEWTLRRSSAGSWMRRAASSPTSADGQDPGEARQRDGATDGADFPRG